MRTTLLLHEINADPALHARTSIRQRAVRQYAESVTLGDEFPPVDAFQASDGQIWLADGFLRYYGTRAAGRPHIEVELHRGEIRDAIRFSCGANSQHGVQRTREDKCYSGGAALLSPDFAGASDQQIASTCRVSRQLVTKLRKHAASRGQFGVYMKEEAHLRWVTRKERQAAKKAALAAAAAPPPPPPAEPEKPLTDHEKAMAALARASAALERASSAMSEARTAYPEAYRIEADIAVLDAECALDELQPQAASSAPAEFRAQAQDALRSLAKESSRHTPCAVRQPSLQPELLHPCGVGVPPAGPARDPQPAELHPRLPQPELLHPPPRVIPLPDLSREFSRPPPDG